MNEEKRFVFNQVDSERLDKYLVKCVSELTRSKLQFLIKAGYVEVNDQIITKTGFSLEAGMEIRLQIPPQAPIMLEAEMIPLDIVFENEDVLVVNKPAGMVIHPSAGHASSTLVNALLAYNPFLKESRDNLRPGIVHRLDKDTSGLILVAKNEKSQLHLMRQFHDRLVEKTYIALVDGKPRTPCGLIDAPVYRDPSHRQKMAIAPVGKGREAETEYFTLENFPRHTLLRVKPLTGRTHQIRVHLASIGCPVVADVVYGRKNASIPLSRHFLHAHSLQVILPDQKQKSKFVAPLPLELMSLLKDLGSSFTNEE